MSRPLSRSVLASVVVLALLVAPRGASAQYVVADYCATPVVAAYTPAVSYYAPATTSYYAPVTASYYAPVTTSYYATPAVSYYSAPAVSHYAAPAVSYYSAPAVSYYTAPAVATTRSGLFGRRVSSYYYPSVYVGP